MDMPLNLTTDIPVFGDTPPLSFRNESRNAPVTGPATGPAAISAERYFVTLCTDDFKPLFGRSFGGRMKANALGRAARDHWQDLPRLFDGLTLDHFALTPSHLHGLITLEADAPHSLAVILRTFKSFSTREINKLRWERGAPVWQQGHDIHNAQTDEALNRIRDYILASPARGRTGHRRLADFALRRETVSAPGQPIRLSSHATELRV